MTRYRSGGLVPETAPVWRRFAAYAVDLGVIMVPFIVAVYTQIPGNVSEAATADELVGFVLPTLLLVLPITLAYFTVFEVLTERTPGKRLLRIRVRRLDGGRVGFMDCFLRNLLRLLWEAPVVGLVFVALDFVTIEWSEMEQRVGDLAAGTIVVMDPA